MPRATKTARTRQTRKGALASGNGYARYSVSSNKLAGEPRLYYVKDAEAKMWSYPGSEIALGPTTQRAAEKECNRLNAHNSDHATRVRISKEND